MEIKFTSEEILEGAEFGAWNPPIMEIPNFNSSEIRVVDENGNLLFPIINSFESGVRIDFTDWEISGTWTIFQTEVVPGKDASPPIELEDFFSLQFLANSKSRFISQKISYPISTPNYSDLTMLGDNFYASGTPQIQNGIQVEAIIPAFGEKKQWVGTDPSPSGEAIFQFQVVEGSNTLWDVLQDSNQISNPEKFFFPENLLAYTENNVRRIYHWRVKVTFKVMDANSSYIWTEWSQWFQFKVNVPPEAPRELKVSRN